MEKKALLKNRTSTIEAHVSMARIEKMLVEMGARHISKQYDDSGNITTMVFTRQINNHNVTFRLPAKVDAVFKLFMDQVKRPNKNTGSSRYAQAKRTAWKLVHDWIEIQHSMVLLEQVEFIEAFLPYTYNMDSDETFFDTIKSSGFKALNQGQ